VNDAQQSNEPQEPNPGHHRFEIQIDRVQYTVTEPRMTGQQLRHVPPTPIGPDRDLFEVVPGGSDIKIGNEQVVEIRNGLRFFTAPGQINPGGEDLSWGYRRVAAQ
jgi:Multiubiquitin